MFGRNHSASTKLILSALKSKNTVAIFDKNNNMVKVFANNVEVAKFLNFNKITVGRYIKSGKLWLDKYYIKIIS
jgi:group I intron endonuclease